MNQQLAHTTIIPPLQSALTISVGLRIQAWFRSVRARKRVAIMRANLEERDVAAMKMQVGSCPLQHSDWQSYKTHIFPFNWRNIGIIFTIWRRWT